MPKTACLIDLSNHALPKSCRLLKRGSFHYLARKGTKYHGRLLTLQVLDVEGDARFGLTVSKKVGKAPTRNLVKRRLRHIISQRKSVLLNRHVVFQAKPAIATATYDMMWHEVERLFEKIKWKAEQRQEKI